MKLTPSIPELKDRNILITGGANGIGAAMVEAFVAQGSNVFLCDLDEDAGLALVDRFESQVVFRRIDLRNEGQINRWISSVHRTHGKIHALINNAGSDPRIPLSETTAAQWDDLFSRNLRSFFLTAKASEPYMPSDGSAAIVNFSSITFHQGPGEMTAYVSTKGGIQGFTRSLARELGPKHIRVNTLSPGWVMTERQLKQFVTPGVKKMLRKEQCIPDLIQPNEIASIAIFLVSSMSSAITGQEILADRGWRHS